MKNDTQSNEQNVGIPKPDTSNIFVWVIFHSITLFFGIIYALFVWAIRAVKVTGKFTFKHSPKIFHGTKRGIFWSAKTIKKAKPARREYTTPDIFKGEAKLAPAREFNVARLNKKMR